MSLLELMRAIGQNLLCEIFKTAIVNRQSKSIAVEFYT